MPIQIKPLSANMGAEVIGADFSKPVSDADFAAILQAFYDYQVLAIRDQHLSPADQIAFSERFGALEDQLNSRYILPEHPQILVLSNDIKADGTPVGLIDAGDFWHTDSSHRPLPSMATILYSLKNPNEGGDTGFANMYAAYEALPQDIKGKLGNVRAVQAVSKFKNKRVAASERRPDAQEKYTEQLAIPDALHPAIRTHPVTGKKALYVSQRFTIGLEGISEEEADPILDFLFEHQTRPEFVYYHHWRDNDLVMWDNRCVIHRATGGYTYPDVRLMHRTVIAGDAPY